MKSTAQTIPLGPWPRGFQNVADPTAVPKGALMEAVNVLIGPEGSITPRKGFSSVSTGVHSLFHHNGRYFGVLNGLLVELFDNGARQLSNIPITGKITWGVLNDEPVFTNNEILARITPTAVKRIGVPRPDIASTGDALKANSVAVSYVNEDDEEGPLSAIFNPVSGGFVQTPTEPGQWRMRVYATPVNATSALNETQLYAGELLYYVGEGAVGDLEAFIVGGENSAPPEDQTMGRLPETMNKERMPGGNYVRYWRGRLLVARGRTLYFSDPLRYGLYDRSSGFVKFEARIDFIEPMEKGIFVALRNVGVIFLAGESPEQWERITADLEPVQPGASVVVSTANMNLELQPKPEWVAVWFTPKGFALGLPSGVVAHPQADLLSGLPLGNGSLHFDGDRLIVLTQ